MCCSHSTLADMLTPLIAQQHLLNESDRVTIGAPRPEEGSLDMACSPADCARSNWVMSGLRLGVPVVTAEPQQHGSAL